MYQLLVVLFVVVFAVVSPAAEYSSWVEQYVETGFVYERPEKGTVCDQLMNSKYGQWIRDQTIGQRLSEKKLENLQDLLEACEKERAEGQGALWGAYVETGRIILTGRMSMGIAITRHHASRPWREPRRNASGVIEKWAFP